MLRSPDDLIFTEGLAGAPSGLGSISIAVPEATEQKHSSDEKTKPLVPIYSISKLIAAVELYLYLHKQMFFVGIFNLT